MNRMIYTIGRQFGSGGRNIGKYIAEKENIPFYDKELLEEAAKESGISEKYFEDYDEKIKKHFFQVMPVGTYSESSMPFVHKVILAQFDAIRKLAKKGPCVFVGRCADYILRERPDVVRIFIRGIVKHGKKERFYNMVFRKIKLNKFSGIRTGAERSIIHIIRAIYGTVLRPMI